MPQPCPKMACIRKNSVQIPISKDELDCMKDSSYQQSTSGADESHPSSANCRIPRNDPKSTLLKTALANRIQPRIPDSANCLSDRNKVRDKNRFIPQREDRLPPPSSSSYQTPRVPRTTSENAIPMSSILERRESSQSDSSRGSNVPKSVTFNDKVEINEIERKDHYNGFDSSNPNFQLIKDTLFKNGWKIQMENNNEILNPMQNLLQPIREDLRSSPSLNLDLVYDETRERPDWMSDEEWIMLQSMYVPSRETSKDPSPPVAFRNPDSDDYPQNSVDDAEVAPSPPPLPDPSAFISVASDSSNVLYPSQQIPSLSSNPRNTNLPSPSNPRSNATTLSRQSSLDKREVQAKPPANQTLNLDVNEGSSTKFKPESGTPISPSKQVLNNGSSQNQTESTTSRPVPPTRRSLSPLKPQPAYPNSSFIKPPSPSKILPSAPQLSPAASQISPLSSEISSPTRDLCNAISSSERPVLYSSPERPAFLPSDRPTTPSATDRPSPSKTFASRAFSPANKSYNTSRSSPSSPVKETNHGPFSRLLPGSLDRLDDELLNTQRMFLNDYSNPSLNSSNTNGHSYLRDSNDYHLQGPSSSFEYNNGQSRYLSVGSSNPSIDHSYQSINRNTYASNTYASINPSGSVFAQNVPSLPSSPTPLRRQNSAFSKGASQNTLTSRGQSRQGLSLSKVPSSSAQNLAKANLSKPALAEDSLASLKNILNLLTGQPTLTSPNTSQLRRPSNLPSGPKSNVSLGQNVPLGSSVPPNASLSSGLKSNLPPGPGSPRKLVKGDVKRLKSPMDLATSFYDNVDAEQQIYLQQQFVNKFGRRKAPIASPEEANRLARKNSMDSNLSTDSRESVVSATSMKTEARIRRFFNY